MFFGQRRLLTDTFSAEKRDRPRMPHERLRAPLVKTGAGPGPCAWPLGKTRIDYGFFLPKKGIGSSFASGA